MSPGSPHPRPDPEAAATVEALLNRVFEGIPWMRDGAVFTLGDARALMLSAYEAGRKWRPVEVMPLLDPNDPLVQEINALEEKLR